MSKVNNLQVTFNHSAKTFPEALGITDGANHMSKVSADISTDVATGKVERESQVAELLYNQLSDAEILLIAAKYITKTVQDFQNQNPLEALLRAVSKK